MTEATLILVLVIVTALAFDFTNGFHDTGNAMATSIATGALRPKVAVGLSAVLNLVGAFLSVRGGAHRDQRRDQGAGLLGCAEHLRSPTTTATRCC